MIRMRRTFLLLTLLATLASLTMPAHAEIIIGSVRFDPKRIDVDSPAPAVVKAIIRFDEPHDIGDINAFTLLLEGTLPPSTTYLIPGALVAEFDGYMIVNILLAIISNMGLPPSGKVWLTITGNLNDTVGGTPFSVTGYIKVTPSRP